MPRLTTDQRRSIQSRLQEGTSLGVLANEFEVSLSTIRRVRDRGVASDVPTQGGFVQARLSMSELAAFEELVQRRGTTKSALIRRMVRLASGVVDYSEEELEALREATRQLVRVGQNLSRILRLAQAGRFTWEARDHKTVQVLIAHQAVLIRQLQVLHIAAGRHAFVSSLELAEGLDHVS